MLLFWWKKGICTEVAKFLGLNLGHFMFITLSHYNITT
jgi:hypothetical protein